MTDTTKTTASAETTETTENAGPINIATCIECGDVTEDMRLDKFNQRAREAAMRLGYFDSPAEAPERSFGAYVVAPDDPSECSSIEVFGALDGQRTGYCPTLEMLLDVVASYAACGSELLNPALGFNQELTDSRWVMGSFIDGCFMACLTNGELYELRRAAESVSELFWEKRSYVGAAEVLSRVIAADHIDGHVSE